MGTSTDAMLVYGYIWEDEFELLGDSEDGEWEWNEVLAKRRGVRCP